MDNLNKLAWTWVEVGVTFTATLVLFGIWRRGYPKYEPDTRDSKISHDEGIMWLFWACALWCCTSAAQIVGFALSKNLEDTFSSLVRVAFSLTNSLFFVLATANLDELKHDPSLPARILAQIRGNPYRILASIIGTAALVWVAGRGNLKYCQDFDAFVSLLAILFIAWGFFRSFWRREFHIVAWLSVGVFSIFTIAQLAEPLVEQLGLPLKNPELLKIAFRVGSGAMVALLFIAMTFSWVHEKTEELAVIIKDIPDAKLSSPR